MDRFLIDLMLGISGPIAKTTYSGIHSVSQFDLSFRIDGQCAETTMVFSVIYSVLGCQDGFPAIRMVT